MRLKLKQWCEQAYKKDGTVFHVATEIEGFIFQSRHAEQAYIDTNGFEFISTGGYYHSLPGDPLRTFIDTAAEVQRAMGFANEKDHPEVAPAQFEMNYSYTEAGIGADQIALYKLICRQVAYRLGMTASFLPKPVTGVNGNGMHTNMSVGKGKDNIFYSATGEEGLSDTAWQYVDRILTSALDLCLILNSSVNAYRRLDPHFEAPNQIMASPIDRGSMVRIPIGNERSARIEVRSMAPDSNPYMALYALMKTGLEGPLSEGIRNRKDILPDNIQDAIDAFKCSSYIKEILGADVVEKYTDLKQTVADRSPRKLGTLIKPGEIQFHHEVSNQFLWNHF
jgi:glutamine synthetase